MKTGKKRWWLVAFILALIVLPVGFHFFQISREPRYEGRPVSYWFKQYYMALLTDDQASHYYPTEPEEALEGMGTNALPYLVKEALSTKQDTALVTNFYLFLDKFPKSWHLPKFISHDDIRDEAVYAIYHINPSASVILPMVQKALHSTNELTRVQALNILGNVREERDLLIPCFRKALKDPEAEAQRMAVDFFGGMGPAAKAVIPDLTELLKLHESPEQPYLGLKTAEVLGNLGPDAAAAVPVLQKMFEHEKAWEYRVWLATALCQIEGRQTNALDFIVRGLKEDTGSNSVGYGYGPSHFVAESMPDGGPDSLGTSFGDLPAIPGDGERAQHDHAAYAVHLLDVIGINAAPAVPDLIRALDGTNDLVWIEAGPALKRMGAPKELYLPILEERLKSADDGTQAVLALCLMNIDPKNQAAPTALIELIRKSSPDAEIVLNSWHSFNGWIGSTPPPKGAIPVLQEAVKSGGKRMREAAAETLKKIEAKDRSK